MPADHAPFFPTVALVGEVVLATALFWLVLYLVVHATAFRKKQFDEYGLQLPQFAQAVLIVCAAVAERRWAVLTLIAGWAAVLAGLGAYETWGHGPGSPAGFAWMVLAFGPTVLTAGLGGLVLAHTRVQFCKALGPSESAGGPDRTE